MQGTAIERLRLSRRIVMSACAWMRYLTPHRPYSSSSVQPEPQNHYELLGLEKGCSASEIKESFIRISKEVHPDSNPDSPELHNQFVALNEAYSVLSKQHLRQLYDADLALRERLAREPYGTNLRTNAPHGRVIFQDESLWEHRDHTQDHQYENQPYYGVSGIKNKLPNSYIAVGAIIFMVVGAIFHFFLARTSSAFTIEQLNRRDQLASAHHALVREQAQLNGNELQMALFRQKSEAASGHK